MDFLELLLLAIGLSMDTFAASISMGVSRRRDQITKTAIYYAVLFGAFHFLMPLLGGLLGVEAKAFISGVDHWIAFAFLAVIGGKMIRAALSPDNAPPASHDHWQNLGLAFSLSMDALTAGLGIAFVQSAITTTAAVIGVTAGLITFTGFHVGKRAGDSFAKPAEILGGLVLIALGLSILAMHLLK